MNATSGDRAGARSDRPDSAATYRIDVAGHLDGHWCDWLGDVALVHNPDATTTLTLDGADQARLYGVLAAIRDLGVRLMSVRTVAGDAVGSVREPERP